MKEAVLILHNIRSEQNVGSLFRTADAAGVSKIYLVGYTPAPIDRFGRTAKGVVKASLGAERLLWEKCPTIAPLLKKLKKDGFRIIAIEQSAGSEDYKKAKIGPKAAFILGNEIDGLPPSALREADIVAEIPMRGEKESLNVAVAGGIAIFRMLRV